MFATPRLVNAQVARDGVKPRRKLGLTLVGLGALDDAHKGFLQQILGGLAVADEPEDEVEDRATVTGEQDLEGTNLAALVLQHEVFVRLVVEHAGS
jgi:hypothetical protein